MNTAAQPDGRPALGRARLTRARSGLVAGKYKNQYAFPGHHEPATVSPSMRECRAAALATT